MFTYLNITYITTYTTFTYLMLANKDEKAAKHRVIHH